MNTFDGNYRLVSMRKELYNSRGNCYGYFDGTSLGRQESCRDDGSSFSELPTVISEDVNSVVDPVCILPLKFFIDRETRDWDDAWSVATEDEKLILIQWMQLK
jgi:hypothetical protein